MRDVIREGDRVIGIRAETSNGLSIIEQARVVVGPDGQRSLIARACGVAEYQVRPAASCNYYTYFSDVPCLKAELYNRDRSLIGVFPTNDDLTLVFEAFPNDGSAGFFRKSPGPGWALAGDAGYHKHPVTAQGISDAFRDADELAAAIDAGLSGARPLEQSLADYARRRDESVMPMYELTCELALSSRLRWRCNTDLRQCVATRRRFHGSWARWQAASRSRGFLQLANLTPICVEGVMFAGICYRFTEGFDTTDLKEAKTLLDAPWGVATRINRQLASRDRRHLCPWPTDGRLGPDRRPRGQARA